MDLEFIIATVCQIYIKGSNVLLEIQHKRNYSPGISFSPFELFDLTVIYYHIPEDESLNNISVKCVVFGFDRQILEGK